MGSPEELADGQKSASDGSQIADGKAELMNMDLYIDPVKESKMMLKFDVRMSIDLPSLESSLNQPPL